MTGETHRIPITAWPRDVFRATVLAYRAAMGAGQRDPKASRDARAAYIAAGGDPERVPDDVPRMVAAAARDHGAWFWRPAQESVEREERYWRGRGIWPPPTDPCATPAILPD